MKNSEIAGIFYEIADMLEMQDVEFKPRAYRKAAQNIESLQRDIEEIYKEGKLEDIPGVGRHIAEKIKELIETNHLKYYEKLKSSIPVDLEALGSIEGLGPKTIKKLYKQLKIKNLKDLENALRQGKLKKLEGFKEKKIQNIIENIDFAKKSRQRFLLGFALPEAEAIKEELKKLKEVEKIKIAGSIRRMNETIGDIDILAAATQAEKVMDAFTGQKEVEKVFAKGPTKSSVRLKSGIQVDLRIIPKEVFGSALQYLTGSKPHSIKLRKIAMQKKLKLSEYGLFRNNKIIAGKTEEELYNKLGMPYIEPELREDAGEIEAALEKKLPKIVKYNEILGDLQMHTEYSDGNNTIKEMAEAAIGLGYKYIAATDHAGTLKIAGSMSTKQILKQKDEIEKLNKELKNIHIIHGVEANIMHDGSLDIDGNILKKMDLVIAAIHSGFKQQKDRITKRMLKAMDNRYVGIIAHPTGRIMQKRKGYEFEHGEIFQKAKDNDIALEINAFPNRLDLNCIGVREAIGHGVKLSIGTDAHSAEQLGYMRFGIATARKGWAEKKDIINTYSLEDLKKFLDR